MGYPTRKSYIERAIGYLFDIFALRPFLVSIYLPWAVLFNNSRAPVR